MSFQPSITLSVSSNIFLPTQSSHYNFNLVFCYSKRVGCGGERRLSVLGVNNGSAVSAGGFMLRCTNSGTLVSWSI